MKTDLKKIRVFPSILAGNFGSLSQEAKRAEESGADGLHIDIMDGHFVPNLSLGPKAVGAIHKATNLFLDVHLMIYNPFDYIERFVEMGADAITFHFEATENPKEILTYIKKCRVRAGIAFSPDTSHEMIFPYMKVADYILLMTVHPGFGAQPFLPQVLEKIKYARELVNQLELSLDIQVDGGINDMTAKSCVKAGANVLISGSYLYGSSDMTGAIETLRDV